MDLHVSINASTGERTEIADNGDGTGVRTTFDADGNVTSTEALTGLPVPEVPTDPTAPVLAAIETARAEVATFSASSGTRQAVEALCDAVETLATGGTP